MMCRMSLKAYLSETGISQREFGDSVGVSQARIAQLLDGQLPSLALAKRIADRTKNLVPMECWSKTEPKPTPPENLGNAQIRTGT